MEKGRLWKAWTIIVGSNEIKNHPEEKKQKFLDTCYKASNALVADRSTAFLPILTAQAPFVGGLAVAVGKAAGITASSSVFINVEAHSIAFSALYFWIIPAVFLSSAIGVSQTEGSIPRILEELRTDLAEEWVRILEDERRDVDTRESSTISASADVGDWSFEHHDGDFELPAIRNRKIRIDGRKRTIPQASELPSPGTLKETIVSGGIYSWQPLSKSSHNSETLFKCLWHLFKDRKNYLPLCTISSGSITAMLISGFVPADGWQARHCAYAAYLSIWIVSFILTEWLKRQASSPHPNLIISPLSKRRVQDSCIEAQTPQNPSNLDQKKKQYST